MKKILLSKLLDEPCLSRNDYISKLYQNEEDIRLCSDAYIGIIMEEDLESILSSSNIDLLISNDELSILVQYNKFYRVKHEKSTACSNEVETYLNFNTLEEITYDLKHKYIELDNGLTYDFKDIKDCVEAIIEEYHRHDASMWDVLASIKIVGLSTEEVVKVYAECMKRSDGDVILHIREEVDEELLKQNEVLGL